MNPLEHRAYNFYKKNCQSIELVKDDELQKVNFRVKNKVNPSNNKIDPYPYAYYWWFIFLSVIQTFFLLYKHILLSNIYNRIEDKFYNLYKVLSCII